MLLEEPRDLQLLNEDPWYLEMMMRRFRFQAAGLFTVEEKHKQWEA